MATGKETAKRPNNRPSATSADKAFLDAIYAAPEDDAPRLVYADALIERGDPRGELIQLQCELARVDEDDERWHRMKHRERALLKAHQDAWTKDIRALGKGLEIELHRGFAELACATAEELARIGTKLIAAAPLVVRFHAQAYERSLAPFLRSDVFARAQSVRLGAWRRRVDLSALSALVDPLPLRRLELDEVGLVRDDVDALVRCRALANLRELEINRCVFGKDSPAPLEALEAPLTRFASLSGKYPEALVRAIASGPAFARLKVLGLCNTSIGDDGLATIAKTGRLGSLEELDVRSSELSAKALSKLLDGQLPASGLRRLLLGGNELNNDVAAQVAAWSGGRALVKLDLGSEKIGNKGALALAASPHLANLRSLVLSNCKVSAETEKKLLASPHLAKARLYVGGRFLKRT